MAHLRVEQNLNPHDSNHKRRRPTASKHEKRDQAVMETNDSCMTSKRSVERLYFERDAIGAGSSKGFYRYFVPKFQRRSPLINRGYWLRMRCVEHVVENFLRIPGDDAVRRLVEVDKVVIVLGCGFDVLPFRLIERMRDSETRNIKFVDVDFPHLIRRKLDVIEEHDALHSQLSGYTSLHVDHGVMATSNRYIAIGTDLENLEALSGMVNQQFDIARCEVLFLAEVSLTYMDVHRADSVIRWAGSYPHAHFCLLEQYLPDGPHHPFAQTMLAHFNKLRSPLHALHSYPSLKCQVDRFRINGWQNAAATDLWTLWSNSNFVTEQERIALSTIEPFDEWEDFALFGSHYFLLVASNSTRSESKLVGLVQDDKSIANLPLAQSSVSLKYQPHSRGHVGMRKHGTIIFPAGTISGDNHAIHHGGLGSKGRLQTWDHYTNIKEERSIPDIRLSPMPDALMNHSTTALGNGKALLVGGRTSPNFPSADCWVLDDVSWQRVQSLAPARYRHNAVFVAPGLLGNGMEQPGILIFGGRTAAATVLDEWALWDRVNGWRVISIQGKCPAARFGASFAAGDETGTWGYLMGGMTQDGVVIHDFWKWRLVITNDGHMEMSCSEETAITNALESSVFPLICRFGAALVPKSWGLLLVGGIIRDGILTMNDEILALERMMHGFEIKRLSLEQPDIRPLLVGFGVISGSDCASLAIVGGGANCFSFGTFWNSGCFTVFDSKKHDAEPWVLCAPQSTSRTTLPPSKVSDGLPRVGFNQDLRQSKHSRGSQVKSVKRTRLTDSAESFSRIVQERKPAILTDLDIGSCTRLWTLDYLKQRIGADRLVVVHVASTQQMSFVNKNFQYITKPFGKFVEGIQVGELSYLRSLSATQPARTPADISLDFPGIASDFCVPPQLASMITPESIHSSPLRISGRLAMWLHYDVMANVLCQIRGRKRVLLFPPSDVQRLGFAPGSSSSDISLFDRDLKAWQELGDVHPHEALLNPGDILFIPPLWMHAVDSYGREADEDPAVVAVNVFFKDLSDEQKSQAYAPGRDVYGNRDLAAYERGRKDIDKLVKSFKALPSDAAEFYLRRLADELSERTAEVADQNQASIQTEMSQAPCS